MYFESPVLLITGSASYLNVVAMGQGKKARKSKPQRRRAKSAAKIVTKGHDFGIPFRSMLLPDPSFLEHLREANVFACAYGYASSEEVARPLPSISLVAENEEPLRKAFEQFKRWAEVSGGDAVHLTIMILKEGGYHIGLSRERSHFVTQCRFQDPLSEPLTMIPMWVKPMDTRHASVDYFGRYLENLVSPFFLCGATAHMPSIEGGVPATGEIKPLDVAQILKFECDFISEDHKESGAQSDLVLLMHQERSRKAKGEKGKERDTPRPETYGLEPMEIFKRRQKIVEQNFPVTLHRLKASKSGQAIVQSLFGLGLKLWQIEQAACNLVISREISPAEPHYVKISSRKLKEIIFDVVRGRFEIADASDDLDWLTQEMLANQVELDAASLLIGVGFQRHKISKGDLQETLRKEGLLEGGANVDP